MKFDLMSDLHIDLSNNTVLNYADIATSNVAVVAGDVSNDPDLTVMELERIAEHYKTVLFVDGNHEHYANRTTSSRADREPDWVTSFFETMFRDHPNITYLGTGRTHVVIDRVAFVGANSWYNFKWKNEPVELCVNSWYNHMNDHHHINADHLYVMGECERQTTNLLNTINKLNENPDIDDIIIVTHTVPSVKCVSDKPNNPVWNSLNGCYFNSLLPRLHKGKVKAHCFGHTHFKQWVSDRGVDMICNPRGYYHENTFDKWAPLQIDTTQLNKPLFGG